MKAIKIQTILQQLNMSLYELNSHYQDCPIKIARRSKSSEKSPVVSTRHHTMWLIKF